MGLPEVIITFQTLAVSAIKRSERGIVALILKDSTKTDFDTKVYKDIFEPDAADWTAANLDYIKLAFLGVPAKVIVERIPADATTYAAALARLKVKRWNWLAIPGIVDADVSDVATWIKGCRDNDKKTFKAVLPDIAADHKGVVNFTTDGIKVGSKTYTNHEYCARLAGIFAGIPFTRSSTFYELPEVEGITESTTPDADIDAGKLILINDNGTIMIGRGVNSFTSTTPTESAQFQKIKIVEGVDQMRDDIRDVFNQHYVGKVPNKYNMKVMFLGSINAYFKVLAKDDVLDEGYDNLATVSTEAQRLYLESIGTDTSEMSDQEVKEYNTGSKNFVGARVKFLDAMEDLYFDVAM